MSTYQHTLGKTIWLAWVLLSAGLIVTAVSTFSSKMDVEADAKRKFDFACSQIRLRIGARMDAHAQILMNAASLFEVSSEVTREDWRAFALRQKLEQYHPGIQALASRW